MRQFAYEVLDLRGNEKDIEIRGQLTVDEVARILKVSNMTVYRMVKAGSLPVTKLRKGYRISEKALRCFITENTL